MTLRVRPHATGTSLSSDTLTINRPVGIQVGELLIAQIVSSGGSADEIASAPAGWALGPVDPELSATAVQWVYVKRAGGSEPASYTWTLSAAAIAAAGGILSVYDDAGGVPVIIDMAGQARISDPITDVEAPSVTTVEDNSLLVALFGRRAGATGEYVANSMTAPLATQYSAVATSSSPTFVRVHAVAGVGTQSVAGASGAKTATFSTSAISVGHMLALAPHYVEAPLSVLWGVESFPRARHDVRWAVQAFPESRYDVRWSVEELVDESAAEYTILLRDWRTLALKGELPEYTLASWSRRVNAMGEFQLDLAADTLDDPTLIELLTIVEVRRNDAPEFAGIILGRTYDAIARTWTLDGPDLTWWLAGRVALPPEAQSHDSVSAVAAETAMLGYVERNLTAPADSARNINGELSDITFEALPDLGRGASVTYNARYVHLDTLLRQIAEAGGLIVDVELAEDYSGYVLRVSEPVDATETSGDTPMVFSTTWQNVAGLKYRQSAWRYRNAAYVLGQGVGEDRTVELVEDAASLAAMPRRETAPDSRNNATSAALIQDGEIVIERSLAELETVEVVPLMVGPTPYRVAWDLGHDVTVSIEEIDVSVDRRIVEVAVTLDRANGEVLRIQLGALERTQARLISDALSRNNRVLVE